LFLRIAGPSGPFLPHELPPVTASFFGYQDEAFARDLLQLTFPGIEILVAPGISLPFNPSRRDRGYYMIPFQAAPIPVKQASETAKKQMGAALANPFVSIPLIFA